MGGSPTKYGSHVFYSGSISWVPGGRAWLVGSATKSSPFWTCLFVAVSKPNNIILYSKNIARFLLKSQIQHDILMTYQIYHELIQSPKHSLLVNKNHCPAASTAVACRGPGWSTYCWSAVDLKLVYPQESYIVIISAKNAIYRKLTYYGQSIFLYG